MVHQPGRPLEPIDVLQNQIDLAALRLQQFVGQHRKSLIAGAVALLAGFGITAVAVAPLANDSTPLVQRLVTEAVVPQGLDAQLEALSAQELSLTRSDITRSIDTPESLLARLGVRDPAAEQMPGMRRPERTRTRLTGRPLEFERLSGKRWLAASGASPLLQAMPPIIAPAGSSPAPVTA